jgi:pimeloyl-[acyl-carrier protein] methyl ester esterase
VILRVERRGTGQTLVALHGWGMNAAVWQGLPQVVGAGWRPLPIELPGHGEAPATSSHTGLDDWADACLLAAPERALWLGWSLGGLVALEAALHAPERVCGLILMTTNPRFVRAPDWPHAMPAETLLQFHDSLIADPAGTLERFLSLQVRGSEAARETLRTLRQEIARRPPPDPMALALGLDLLRGGDLRARLCEIRCPTLWLFGQHDTLVPAAVAEGIAALLPEARLRVIPGAGHAPMLSHRTETAAEITAFLGGVAC